MRSEQVGYVATRLSDIDTTSEQLFLSLGRGFPRLLDELRRNLDSSAAHLDRFVDPRGPGTHIGGQLNTIWGETHSILDAASRYFSALAVRDKTVFVALREGIDRLSALKEHIDGLREDALDMEVLAINAVITARRAGEAGRGFAYIANELKRLAAATVAGTETLAERGASAIESLKVFQVVVEEIAAFQQQFFGEFETQLGGGFDDLQSQVKELSISLRQTVEQARGVERPLRRIMEEIQIQDIIMQSISHVTLVAERAKDDGTVTSDDGVTQPMAQLCVDLLLDIREKLASSLGVFAENLAELRLTLSAVGDDQGTGLESAFSEPLELLRQITVGIHTSNDHRFSLREQGSSITGELTSVLAELSSLSASVTKLYPIKVLSRVQIAKEKKLEENQRAIEGIAEFVQSVSTHVGGTLADISAGLGQIEKVVGDYSDSSDHDVQVSEGLSADIESAATNLDTARTGLVGGLSHFSVFSSRFHELLEAAEGDVERIGELVVEIDEMISHLGGADTPAMSDPDDGDNEVIEDVVGTLVERFTIARHKSAAASLVGMELQEGSREGELTLF